MPVDARVEVTAVIDRRVVRRSFRLPLEGGVRLKLSNVLSQRTLGISRIDNLLGPARDMDIITSTRRTAGTGKCYAYRGTQLTPQATGPRRLPPSGQRGPRPP